MRKIAFGAHVRLSEYYNQLTVKSVKSSVQAIFNGDRISAVVIIFYIGEFL